MTTNDDTDFSERPHLTTEEASELASEMEEQCMHLRGFVGSLNLIAEGVFDRCDKESASALFSIANAMSQHMEAIEDLRARIQFGLREPSEPTPEVDEPAMVKTLRQGAREIEGRMKARKAEASRAA